MGILSDSETEVRHSSTRDVGSNKRNVARASAHLVRTLVARWLPRSWCEIRFRFHRRIDTFAGESKIERERDAWLLDPNVVRFALFGWEARRPFFVVFVIVVRMGRCPNPRTKGKRSGSRGTNKSSRKEDFLLPHADQVFKRYHEKKETHVVREPMDETLPGMGQFYCVPTGRYFESEAALRSHMRTKEYRRTLRRLERDGKPHDRKDAERAAGTGKDDDGRKKSGMSMDVVEATRTEPFPFDL